MRTVPTRNQGAATKTMSEVLPPGGKKRTKGVGSTAKLALDRAERAKSSKNALVQQKELDALARKDCDTLANVQACVEAGIAKVLDPLGQVGQLFAKMTKDQRIAARRMLDELDATDVLAPGWTDSEKERRASVLGGLSVVANKKKDKRLIAWAQAEGLLVEVDRGTPWGNPYKLASEKHRDDVCDRYEEHIASRPDLQTRLDELRGKVLACWCYPKRCHGMHLCELASAKRGNGKE